MNNFEERMLCDYLLKVKDKINFCSVEFRDFYLDLKKQLNLSESEFPIYLLKTVSDYSKFEKAFIRSLKKNLKNLKIKNTSIPPRIPPIVPPIAPAQVFLGERRGQSFFAVPFLILL